MTTTEGDTEKYEKAISKIYDEINYAISALDVRWEDQCLYVAMDYISQGYDKETVLRILAEDGFTQSEIAYVHAQHYALVEGAE